MDERQLQIRERAGLEESRLNEDFILFLRKWSTPVLLVIAIAAVGFALYQRRTQGKQAELAAAFAELEAARASENPNPSSLAAIAETYANAGAVPVLAHLEAGDIYLDAVRRGIKPGSEISPDGTAAADALMDEASRKETLASARSHYDSALRVSLSKPAYVTHVIAARFGLAAVEESEGAWDNAKAQYEQIETVAKNAGFGADALIAQERIATLPAIAEVASLPSTAQVPALLDTAPPSPPAPAPESPTQPVQLPQAGLNLSPAAQTPAQSPVEPPAEQPATSPDTPPSTPPANPPENPK